MRHASLPQFHKASKQELHLTLCLRKVANFSKNYPKLFESNIAVEQGMEDALPSTSPSPLETSDPPKEANPMPPIVNESQPSSDVYLVTLNEQSVFPAIARLLGRKEGVHAVYSVPKRPDSIFVEAANQIEELFEGLQLKSIEKVAEVDVTGKKIKSLHRYIGRLVRLSRNDYSNDVAQIVDVTPENVLVKLFPRVDYEGMKEKGVTSQRKLFSLMPREYEAPAAPFDVGRVTEMGGQTERASLAISWADGASVEAVKWDDLMFVGQFLYLPVEFSQVLIDAHFSDVEVARFRAGMAPFEKENKHFRKHTGSGEDKQQLPTDTTQPKVVTLPSDEKSILKPGDVALIRPCSKFRGLIVEVDSVDGREATYHPIKCQMIGHITHFTKTGEAGVGFSEKQCQASFIMPTFRVGDMIEAEDGRIVVVYRRDWQNNMLEVLSLDNQWSRVSLALDTAFKPLRLLTDDNSCVDYQGNRVSLNDQIVTKDGAYGRVGRTWKNHVVCLMDDESLRVYPDSDVKVRGLPPALRPAHSQSTPTASSSTARPTSPPKIERPRQDTGAKWLRPGVVVVVRSASQQAVLLKPPNAALMVTLDFITHGKRSGHEADYGISALSPAPINENDHVLVVTDTREYTGTVKWVRSGTVGVQVDKSKVVRDAESGNVFKYMNLTM